MLNQIICIVVLLILLQWVQQDILLDKKIKRCYFYCILLALIVVFSEVGCSAFDNTTPENRVWSILFNMIGFGVSPFVFLIESRIFNMNQFRNRWIYIPALMNLFFVCISPLTGWIFSVDEQCIYQRGQLFWLYIAAFLFSVFVLMVRTLRAMRNYPRYFKTRIMTHTIFLILGLAIQIICPDYLVSWLIISVYLVLHYALICEMNGMIDGLTGLLNRMTFNKYISDFKRKKGKIYYLIMLDANDFKSINDTRGHAYGDFCLKEISNILVHVFGKHAYIFRLGGDEFCIIGSENNKDAVMRRVTESRQIIAEKQKTTQPFPGLAIGCKIIEDGKGIRDVLEAADLEMYANKKEMKQKTAKQAADDIAAHFDSSVIKV